MEIGGKLKKWLFLNKTAQLFARKWINIKGIIFSIHDGRYTYEAVSVPRYRQYFFVFAIYMLQGFRQGKIIGPGHPEGLHFIRNGFHGQNYSCNGCDQKKNGRYNGK
jgi:hypothetical protein